MEKNSIELTRNKDVDMERCIEAVNYVKGVADEVKIELLNDNKDVNAFILVDNLCKELTHAAYWAEQLKWELLRRK